MADTWPGVVVRTTKGEKGVTPRASAATSPDILISGKSPFEDPSFLTDPANYDKSYDYDLFIGWPNYLYIRGKNFSDNDLTGSWNLFYAEPNILLYPYLWEENQLATSSGNQSPHLDIKAGAIGASTDPFTWVPPDVSDHYCLIGIANTPEHGNPLSGVTNINSLAEILSTNANIAQRNVKMVRGAKPQVVDRARYDQGSDAALVDLVVVFKNIPKGTNYTISSGTPLNGKALSHSQTNTQDNDFKYGWVNQDIPAHWNSMFTYTLEFGKDWKGIPDGAKPEVEIRGELVVSESSPLFRLGVDPGPDPITGKARVCARGGPVRILTAGSVRSIFPDYGN